MSISPATGLLNTTAAILHSRTAFAPAPARSLDGERALLGSPAGGFSRPKAAIGWIRPVVPVDGEQALLGRPGAAPSRGAEGR